jgi:hypothetical protein
MLTPGEISRVQGWMVRVWSAGGWADFAAEARSRGGAARDWSRGWAMAPAAERRNDLRFNRLRFMDALTRSDDRNLDVNPQLV